MAENSCVQRARRANGYVGGKGTVYKSKADLDFVFFLKDMLTSDTQGANLKWIYGF